MRLRAGFGGFHARRVTAGRLRARFGVFHARSVTAGRLQAGFGVFHARRVTDGRQRARFGGFHARSGTDGRQRARYQIGGWVTSIILQCVGHIIQGRRASKKSKVKLMTISSLQRFGGGYRIRTCGAFQPTCFRDKHHKPLGQSSVFCDAKITIFGEIINPHRSLFGQRHTNRPS